MADVGTEFEIAGEPVGYLRVAMAPRTDGLYHYMPYRGPGHLHMQQQPKSPGFARCSYRDSSSEVSFTVVECPSYGVLRLTSFDSTAGAP